MKTKIIISTIFVIFLVIFFSAVNDNYFFNRSICREKKEKYILKLDAIVTIIIQIELDFLMVLVMY